MKRKLKIEARTSEDLFPYARQNKFIDHINKIWSSKMPDYDLSHMRSSGSWNPNNRATITRAGNKIIMCEPANI